jgi:hypothetical protein
MNSSSLLCERIVVIFISRENLSIRHAGPKILGSQYSKKIERDTAIVRIASTGTLVTSAGTQSKQPSLLYR